MVYDGDGGDDGGDDDDDGGDDGQCDGGKTLALSFSLSFSSLVLLTVKRVCKHTFILKCSEMFQKEFPYLYKRGHGYIMSPVHKTGFILM